MHSDDNKLVGTEPDILIVDDVGEAQQKWTVVLDRRLKECLKDGVKTGETTLIMGQRDVGKSRLKELMLTEGAKLAVAISGHMAQSPKILAIDELEVAPDFYKGTKRNGKRKRDPNRWR